MSSDRYTIDLTITDNDGGSTRNSTRVTVNNVAPSDLRVAVQGIGTQDNKARPNKEIDLVGSFTDIGLLGSHVVHVDWDDTSPDSTFELKSIYLVNTQNGDVIQQQLLVGDGFNSTSDGAVLMITSVDPETGKTDFEIASHQYATGGLFDVSLTVRDDDGGFAKSGTDVWGSGARQSHVGLIIK